MHMFFIFSKEKSFTFFGGGRGGEHRCPELCEWGQAECITAQKHPHSPVKKIGGVKKPKLLGASLSGSSHASTHVPMYGVNREKKRQKVSVGKQP